MRPLKDDSDAYIRTGIDDPFLTEQGTDDRDYQIAGIGIFKGGLLNGSEVQEPSDEEVVDNDRTDMGDNGGGESQDQPGA